MNWYKTNQIQQIEHVEPFLKSLRDNIHLWMKYKHKIKKVPVNLELARTKTKQWIIFVTDGDEKTIFVADEPNEEMAIERALQNLTVLANKHR